jgi:hypothetical protein
VDGWHCLEPEVHRVPPYGNDQHPYLIWNLYRTNSDGRLEQIGRSGVKHAWLTTNGSCLDSTAEHDSHILGRGCLDTYGTGNNDTSSDLGPRSEIVPATGIWGVAVRSTILGAMARRQPVRTAATTSA